VCFILIIKTNKNRREETMKKTITTDQALLILSDVITFYFEMRGKTDDREEIKLEEAS
jgi:CHASE3 domain sensor protein